MTSISTFIRLSNHSRKDVGKARDVYGNTRAIRVASPLESRINVMPRFPNFDQAPSQL